MEASRKLRVAFLHPDLGIGGAERPVGDGALALQRKGHSVHLFTPHHDRSHCFPETLSELQVTRAGGALVPATVAGGRMRAVCAVLRMVLAALYVALFSDFRPDVVFVDQVESSSLDNLT